MAAVTKLDLSTIDMPPYAALGLTQTITPIQQSGFMRRTVDGDLIDLSDEAFDKYASNVSCNHFQHPSLNGLRRGQTVVVDCIVEFSYVPEPGDTTGTAATRTIVPGSVRIKDGFLFYRPRLTMKVTNISVNRDEFGAQSQWSLDLEEI